MSDVRSLLQAYVGAWWHVHEAETGNPQIQNVAPHRAIMKSVETDLGATEARVSVLQKALRDLLGCFVFHTALDDSPAGMIDWWTIKAGTRYGSYEDCGIPMSTVQAVRAANAALDEPNRKKEPSDV